ncbi:MAG: NADH-quinone oxidoreductase subunit L [Legionellales bacterium]|nr:NADH-quinone oxidoreductase subunit L [Legionellales bacterium]
MFGHLTEICLAILLLPLFASLIVGISGGNMTIYGAHRITTLSVGVTFILSILLAKSIFIDNFSTYNDNIYSWFSGKDIFPFSFHFGFMIDELSVVMLVVVSLISLLVHIYSIGYMEGDDGYKRFFSYISFFTFAMYLLVLANNFLQLFIGWEGVGVASYLLIGFWFKKESAINGGLKAFLVNRVSDFGFILGLAVIFSYTGSLDYQIIFANKIKMANSIVNLGYFEISAVTLVCFLLFWGAMGKSAQIPLHVWLPESMEGPTPISALIHAATMVTAGVFMVARMSPLFELSEAILSFILIVGATGALFTGLIALVVKDIKRVVAYSTLSQLGYMMVAMGSSAYAVGIFHLITHACFKALLFLCAGSVILAMHHEQDMTKMGGLRKHLPVTYWTCLLGSLALVAFPPFAGCYSKDMIIQAAKVSGIFGAQYSYSCVLLGTVITGIYTFRAFFMTFHGKSTHENIKEPGLTVKIPLIILAILSICIGGILFEPFLVNNLLNKSVTVMPEHNAVQSITEHFNGHIYFMYHAFGSLVFWLTFLGILIAYFFYYLYPNVPNIAASKFGIIYYVLTNKYGFDSLYEVLFVKSSKFFGGIFTKIIDNLIIDTILVDGLGVLTTKIGRIISRLQTGLDSQY